MRWHGRAGQGAKSVSELIAEAAMDSGKHIQAFPQYGPEKTGAPMQTFIKISNKPIISYSPIRYPDAVIVIDPTLVYTENVTSGLSKDGTLVMNTPKSAKEIKKLTKFKGKIFTIDASKLAMRLGMPRFTNTVMLGAAIRATKVVDLEKVTERLRKLFLKKLGPEKTKTNINAVKTGYTEVME
jgi:pyruvate ferredoxin oxidoreductase gamma subunit